MKKIGILLIALTTTISSVAASEYAIPPGSLKTSSQALNVINACKLTEAEINTIMRGEHPEIAIEFTANTFLPISFFLKGDLIQLSENPSNKSFVEIKQTFYARHSEGNLILSSNLTDWKPFLEFITGNISVSFMIQDGQPSFFIEAETNKRF